MSKLSTNAYHEIRKWIYRNARQIELSLWEYYFENGSKENVITALMHYQNEDGGFGNTLEADSWNPNSSPYTTAYAISILKSIGLKDTNHAIMQGIFNYLNCGQHFENNMWLFTIPSNDEYARAPWWTYNSESNKSESIGVTAELIAFVLQYFPTTSELYQKVVPIAKEMFEKLMEIENFGDMGINGIIILAETIKELNIGLIDMEKILLILQKLVFDSIERDTGKWPFYGVRPSNYINSPNSIYYKQNEDIVQKELDYLIDTRPQISVWDITWSWFDNNEKYPREFAISENWWKAYKAIEKMVFLRNFDKIC